MHDEHARETPPTKSTDTVTDAGVSRRIRSEELFRGVREIVIEHGGRQYQLRITQSGKLILTA